MLPVRVQISTALPVSVRELPKLQDLIETIAANAGHPTDKIYMEQQGADLVLYFDLNKEKP